MRQFRKITPIFLDAFEVLDCYIYLHVCVKDKYLFLRKNNLADRIIVCNMCNTT